MAQGDFPSAASQLEEGNTLAVANGHARWPSLAQAEVAARLPGAASAIRDESGISLEPALTLLHSRTVASIHNVISADAFDREFASGRTITRAKAISAALATRSAPAPKATTTFTTNASPGQHSQTGQLLTRRELEILRLLADGLSTTYIADRLSIRYRTVSTHTKNFLGKLRVETRAAAIA